MKLSMPQGLSRCDNRHIKAKTNVQTGGPEDWFTPENMAQLGYKAFSFDFFVNWNTNKFVNCLWMKRFIDVSVSELIQDINWKDNIAELLKELEGEERLIDLYNFCCTQGLHADFLIFNDDLWSVDPLIIYVRVQADGYKIKTINLETLKEKIRMGTGRAFTIGSKGLGFSTSSLECLLSKTDTPYPGDADVVLANDNYSEFVILEFKKHNLLDPLSQQRLSNYYPRPDSAKYNRLNMLRQWLPNARLYTVYYTTDARNETKLELNAYGKATLDEYDYLELHSPSNKNDQEGILEYVRQCAYFFNKPM